MTSILTVIALAVIALLLLRVLRKWSEPPNSAARQRSVSESSSSQPSVAPEPTRKRPIGAPQTIDAGGVKVTAQIFIREKNAQEKRAEDLLKQAAGNDADGAIRCLREAYELMQRSSIIYPIETYLRLPLYLQKAGRFDEAQWEFQALLGGTDARVARDFAHQNVKNETRKGIAAMERHGIYRAMCTAYRREGKKDHVILFGFLDHASWCVGLQYQNRSEELDPLRSTAAWNEIADKRLEDIALASQKGVIMDACLRFSKECTDTAFATLEGDLRAVLLGEREPHHYFLSRMLRLFDTDRLAGLEYWDEKLGASRYDVLKKFLNEGLVELLSAREQIAEDYSVASLKSLCNERGLKLSGKKADLIERILTLDSQMEATLAPKLRFVRCTDAGKRIVMAYHCGEVEGYRTVEAKVRAHLCDGNLTDAIGAACAYKASMLFPQGSEPESFQIKVLGAILSSTLGNSAERMEAAVMYLMPEWYPGQWVGSADRSQNRIIARELIQSARTR